MKKFVAKATAGAAVIAAALLLTPTTAHAVPGYPEASDITISNVMNVAPGGTVTTTVRNLIPGARVTFTLTGENGLGGGINLATLKAAPSSSSASMVVPGSGSVTATTTLPANASCDYTLTAVSGGWSQSWPITVSGCLTKTGAEQQPLLMLWAGAGALALLGGGVVVAASVRKQRKLAA